MSTPCLIFVRSWIPWHHVNSCHFWMLIRAIIKSASPLMKKKKQCLSLHSGSSVYQDVIRTKEQEVTYQKCVQIILEAQIGRNVEAYINDIVVKSKKQGDLLDDLKETLDNLHKYKMMLNPKNACLVFYQENCSTTWYRPRGSMRTQRRWRSSNNCSHLILGKKSRSWQA
jgi:type VI protein secretion system component VasK